MSIKSFVNNKVMLDSFIEYLEGKQEVLEKSLASETEVYRIYRLQGELKQIEKLKMIREDVLAHETAAG